MARVARLRIRNYRSIGDWIEITPSAPGRQGVTRPTPQRDLGLTARVGDRRQGEITRPRTSSLRVATSTNFGSPG